MWHDRIEEEIVAGAILDRITAGARTMTIDCPESLRLYADTSPPATTPPDPTPGVKGVKRPPPDTLDTELTPGHPRQPALYRWLGPPWTSGGWWGGAVVALQAVVGAAHGEGRQ